LQQHIDDAIRLENERGLKAHQQRAADLAAYMQRKNLDPRVQQQYEALGGYIRDQQVTQKQTRELFERAYKKSDSLKREEADARARASMGSLLGMFTAFASYSPGETYYRPSTDTFHRTPDSLDTATLASGLGMIAESQMTYAQEQTRLNVAKAAFAKQTAEE
jgi:hypothetical protein